MTDRGQTYFICVECIGDIELRSHISDRGEMQLCSFGHEERDAIAIEDLAEIVDRVYRAYHTPGDWIMVPVPDEIGDHDHVQQGDSPEVILSEMLWCEPEVAEALLAVLEPNDSYAAAADGAQRMYDPSENYQFQPPSSAVHIQTWERFAERIKHRRRFLDPENLSDLASILHNTHDVSEAPWLSVRKLDTNSRIYRARRCESDREAWAILARPVSQLAPPPPPQATAGRMNPAGIAVFYGALEEETAVSEVRPWVGSLVVVGGFEPIRDLRLLDLSGLGDAGSRVLSMFSNQFAEDYSRRQFLVAFEEIVARPIGPQDSDIEFLPTQIVAEYVNSVLDLDGIIYGSAQNAGEGTNLVIFPGVEDGKPPLKLIHESIRTVQVTSSVTEYELRPEFETNDLTVLFDRLPRITRQWNENQLDLITAIFDPGVGHREMNTRLHRAVQSGAAIVASMAILAESLDDEAVRTMITDVVDHYRERLPFVQKLAGAAMAGDHAEFLEFAKRYEEVTGPDQVRPLLEAIYLHPRVVRIFEVNDLDPDTFIKSLFGPL